MTYPIEERTQEILIKCITGDANSADYKEAYDWINQKIENKAYFDSLYSTWLATGLLQPVDERIETNVWEKINSQTDQLDNKIAISPKTRFLELFIKVAAVFIVAFSLGIIAHTYYSRYILSPQLCTIEAPKGAKSKVTLIDGTRVWLNSGSKLMYSSGYNQKVRDIFLTGEAYFEVAKNKSKPFKVHAGNIVIRALGTVFNVKAYPDEEIVETTLVEGLVSIEKAGKNEDKNPLILKPNQHAVYYKNAASVELGKSKPDVQRQKLVDKKLIAIESGRIILTKTSNPEIYTSWKDKRLVFNREEFGEFALKLERLYDIKISIEDTELRSYKLTGSIEQENIEMVLKALQLIIPIDYKFEHKKVIVKIDKKLKSKFDQILK